MPLTLMSVIMTDCVELEIYFGEKLRLRAFEVVAFGTVIVKRALAFGDVGAVGVDGDDDAATIGAAVRSASGEEPPPEQLHSAIIAAQERMRLCMDVLLSGALT
jgi:hypothetical protein